MISILELTTSDAVRALLGVDEEEISDDAMYHAELDSQLLLDVSEWLPQGESIDAILAAGTGAVRGSEEDLKLKHLGQYAKAFCAYQLAIVMDNWRLIRLTDGNIDGRRSLKTDIEALRKRLMDLMETHKEGLLDLVDPGRSSAVFSLIGKSEPGYDPVTDT